MVINDSVGWGVDRGVGAGFHRVVHGKSNISKVKLVWRGVSV